MTRLHRLLSLMLVGTLVVVARAQDILLFPQSQLTGIVDFDVDGDGLKDSIGVDYTASLVIRHGHGNGTFEAGVPVVQQFFSTVIAGDVTGDGIPDIVGLVGVPNQTALDVLPGTGKSIGAQVETPIPGSPVPQSQQLVDVNGDGLLDWVALETPGAFQGSYAIHVALSGGDGAFSFAATTSVPEGADALALGDFDGDGTLDAATLVGDSAVLSVRLGIGDGTFASAPISSSLPASVTSVVSAFNPALAALDLDGDGLCDLIFDVEALVAIGGPFEGIAGNLHAEGGGRFSSGLDFAIASSGELSLGDTNGDGVQDAVVFMDFGVATLLGDGVGGLRTPIVSAATDNVTAFPGNNVPDLVDVDDDGILDANLGLSFLQGRGDGSFVGGTHLSVDGNGPRDVAVADMNGDGAKDLVVARKKKAKSLVVMLGDGQAGFEPHETAAVGAQDLALGDLDGDGDVDILATDQDSAVETAIRVNDGSGLIFSAPAPVLSFMALTPQLHDVDGDGSLDLLTAQPGQKDMLLLRGNGQGGFQPAQTLTSGVVASQFELVDLDSDGTQDIVIRVLQQSKLTLLSGLGGGTFGTPHDIPVPVVPNSFAVADLNLDGLQDLAVGIEDANGHGLHVLFAQAPGVFGPDLAPDETYNVENLRAADLDRDGSPDLVTIQSIDELHVFRNLGNGELATSQSSEIIDPDANLLLDDVNGDGYADAVVWDTSALDISVLPNVAASFPNLGYQHAASFGTPHLATTGAPVPHTKVSFTAAGVPEATLGALFLGLDFTPEPFAGGTLVPSPNVILPMRPELPLVGRWPDLPPGTKVFAQAWFTASGDAAATNAVMAISQ